MHWRTTCILTSLFKFNPTYAKLNGKQSTSNPEIRLTSRNGDYNAFFPRTKASGKPNEALQSERKSGERPRKAFQKQYVSVYKRCLPTAFCG